MWQSCGWIQFWRMLLRSCSFCYVPRPRDWSVVASWWRRFYRIPEGTVGTQGLCGMPTSMNLRVFLLQLQGEPTRRWSSCTEMDRPARVSHRNEDLIKINWRLYCPWIFFNAWDKKTILLFSPKPHYYCNIMSQWNWVILNLLIINRMLWVKCGLVEPRKEEVENCFVL